MVELPRLEDGKPHIVCSTCSAKDWSGGRYCCNQDKLDGEEKRQPMDCPILLKSPAGSGAAYAILRGMLRRR